MDNKNEKTFADLFSSVDDEENKEITDNNKATFDSLVNEVFSENNDKVSFGDISDVAEASNGQVDTVAVDFNTLNISENVNESSNNEILSINSQVDTEKKSDIQDEKKDNLVFGEIADTKDIFSDNNVNEEKSILESNVFFNNEPQEIKDEVIETSVDSGSDVKEAAVDSNIFFSNKLEEDDKSNLESNNLFFNNEKEIKNETVQENIDFAAKEVSNENNMFFNDKIDEDNKANLILDNDNKSNLQESNLQENDIFGFGNKNEDSSSNENLFTSNTNEQANGESINQMLVENENKKLLESKEKTDMVSVSPFFQDSNKQLDKVGENIFNDGGISFDQTKKIDSKLDKIDLSGTKNFNVKLVKKKVPLVKFIMGVISYAFFIFLVLILVTLLAYVLDIKIRASKGDYSAPTFNAYVVLTGSMLPEIQVKDVVVTKKIDADDLKVGDIITFASSDSRFAGTIITHRILKKNQDSNGNITFQTKGDNNNVADSALVQPNNIYGKVILKIPKLGYLQDFLATQGGWIIVILLPCVTVISYDVVKLAKGIKRRKNKIKVIK